MSVLAALMCMSTYVLADNGSTAMDPQHREKLLAEAIARDERLAELEGKYGETKRRLEEFRKENSKFFGIQVGF